MVTGMLLKAVFYDNFRRNSGKIQGVLSSIYGNFPTGKAQVNTLSPSRLDALVLAKGN